MIKTAIVTADTSRVPPETRVGGVGILSRAILVCRKAEIPNIIVAVNGPVDVVRARASKHWKVAEDESIRWIDWTNAAQRATIDFDPSEPVLLVSPAGVFFPDTITELAAAASDHIVAGIAGTTDKPAHERYTGLAVIPGILPGASSTLGSLHEQMLDALRTETAGVHEVADTTWRPVHGTRKSIRAAKKLLFTRVTKPTSGFVSRRINSLISIPISKILVELPVTPNQVSVSTLVIGFTAAGLLAIDAYWALCLAGLLWQFAAVVDRCDGEIARTKHMETTYGAWIDTMADQTSYFVFYLGVIYGMLVRTGEFAYLYFGLFTLAMTGAAVLLMMRFARKQNIGTLQTYNRDVVGKASANGGLIVRLMSALKFASKRDFFSFMFMWFCVFDFFTALYWGFMIGSLIVAVGVFVMNRRMKRMAPTVEAAS
jgi:phosphatidylglycerophosphate synthase